MIICEYVKSIMEKFSVVLFAIFTCICYATGLVEFSFNDILKEVCMVFFFTSVGFQANLKVLKSGGKALIVFLGLVIVLIVSQNFLAVGLAKLMHISPLIGLCTGSIPMVGGHGTAGAFEPVLEDFGVAGASTLCTAGATFGLIAGSMMGGPIGKRLIEKKIFWIPLSRKMTAFLLRRKRNTSVTQVCIRQSCVLRSDRDDRTCDRQCGLCGDLWIHGNLLCRPGSLDLRKLLYPAYLSDVCTQGNRKNEVE